MQIHVRMERMKFRFLGRAHSNAQFYNELWNIIPLISPVGRAARWEILAVVPGEKGILKKTLGAQFRCLIALNLEYDTST